MPKKKARVLNRSEDENRFHRKKKRNRWKECLWKELCDEAVSHFKSMDYERAILHFNRMEATDRPQDDKTAETSSINRHVNDILGITGQNEVIQSFVRSEVSNDSEETQKDGGHKLKEKKRSTKKLNETVGSSNLAATSATEKFGRDSRDDQHAKGTVQFYPSLGKDAQPASELRSKKSGPGWNRRQRIYEEVYTDKDRAAAVNLGSRDIKQSLKMKRRQDRTRILEISEETHPGTLLALAVQRYKNGDVYVAMKFVTKALELNPFDRNALVARSKCHLFMGNAHLALKDAEQALKEDKHFIKGIYQKAEALYHLAQFEYSLMYFHRGLHIRHQMEDFRQGVLKAQQAILNTIGKTVPSFEKFLSEKKKNRRQTDVEESDPSGKNMGIPADLKLLKGLQSDKQYLEYLMHHPDILGTNGSSKKENKIFIEAQEGMQFLEKRQNFWRQQQALTPARAAQPTRCKANSKKYKAKAN